MALADSSCCELENSELRLSCFFNKVGFVLAYFLGKEYGWFFPWNIEEFSTIGDECVGIDECWR